MKSQGKWKKLLYVAAPVLWCSVLYVGSNNSLGTVLAKSVTTITQTLTAIETAVRTQTAVWTMTLTGTEGNVTVSAETETMVLKNTETVVAAATETETSVEKTETETLIMITIDTGYSTETMIMSQTLTGTETEVTQATGTDEAVMTETATVAVTEVSTQAETETMQETMTLTQLLTMTEMLTAVDDGEEDQVINQIVPVRTPTEEKQEEWQELWKPRTKEEKQRASYVYPGKVFTKAEGVEGQEIKSPISVKPAMQGSLCIDAMKRNLSQGYSIAYTYNITYGEEKAGEKKIYSIDEPIRITMSIPKELLKEGRSFEMICVSENGATYKIPAEVDENGNLTFTTRYFYAYALTYKDV